MLGSGLRATHDAMTPAERDTVRAHTLAGLERDHVTAIETNVVYAVATKADPDAAVPTSAASP